MEPLDQARVAIAQERFAGALAILEPLAEAGEAEAQFLLGYLFFSDAPLSQAEAVEWVARAAAQRHPDALFYAACFRSPPEDDVLFGPPNTPARWALTLEAAQLGAEEAQSALGAAYAYADEDERFPWPLDAEASRFWYTQAAAQGNPDAQDVLGRRWLHGEGGPADPATGVHWLSLAAQQACGVHTDSAAELLADLFTTGRFGVVPDAQAAETWRAQAATLAAAPARCGCRTCRSIRMAGASG
jgi:TPR repeat protein